MWSDYFPDYYGGFGNASAPWYEGTGAGGGGVNSSDNSPFGPTIPNSGWAGSVANTLAPYNPTWPQYDPSNPGIGPVYFPWPDPAGGGGSPFPPIFIEPFPTVYPNPPEPETSPSTGMPPGTEENPNTGSGEAYRKPQTGTRTDPETGRPTLTLPNEGPGPAIGGQIPGRGSVDWRVPAAVGSAGAAIGAILAGQGGGQGPVTQPQPPPTTTDPSVPPVVPPPATEPPPQGPVVQPQPPESPADPGRGGTYVPPGPVLMPKPPVEYKPPTAGPPPVLEEPIIPPPVLPPVTDPTLPGPPPTTPTTPTIPKIPDLGGIISTGSGAPLPGPFAPLVGAGPTQSVFQNNYQATPVATIGDLLSQFMQMYGGR